MNPPTTASASNLRAANTRTRKATGLLAVLLATSLTFVGLASPADAYVTTSLGGWAAATYSCDALLHTSTVTAAAGAERGYSTQTVDVRFRWYRYNTGRWSVGGWQRFRTGQALYNDWVSQRGTWAIYAEYRFWRGSGWSPILQERLALTQVGLVPGTSTTGWTCRT